MNAYIYHDVHMECRADLVANLIDRQIDGKRRGDRGVKWNYPAKVFSNFDIA